MINLFQPAKLSSHLKRDELVKDDELLVYYKAILLLWDSGNVTQQ